MPLQGGPVKGDRASRSANISAANSPLRAYARVEGPNVMHCFRRKLWTLHLVQLSFLT